MTEQTAYNILTAYYQLYKDNDYTGFYLHQLKACTESFIVVVENERSRYGKMVAPIKLTLSSNGDSHTFSNLPKGQAESFCDFITASKEEK